MKDEGLFDRRDEDRWEGGDNWEERTCAEDLDFQEQALEKLGQDCSGARWE